jgi:hypothetical protein
MPIMREQETVGRDESRPHAHERKKRGKHATKVGLRTIIIPRTIHSNKQARLLVDERVLGLENVSGLF